MIHSDRFPHKKAQGQSKTLPTHRITHETAILVATLMKAHRTLCMTNS